MRPHFRVISAALVIATASCEPSPGPSVGPRRLPVREQTGSRTDRPGVEAPRPHEGRPGGRAAVPGELARLRVFRDGYPRAYFFRASEGWAANKRISYESWAATFDRLMGIEGKALDEEVPGRAERNVEFFTRLKKTHPDQLVLLHYNGNARDPRYQTEGYFAGHWIYYNGAKVLSGVPAEEGETDVRVDRPELFSTGTGRYRAHNEDVGLCLVDAGGRPNWHESEQVQLVSVDRERGVLRVRRGCYGTKPRAFPAGSYAAAHAHEGPWGRRSNLMWYYNYSTRCPRDAGGRACGDVHAEELSRRFAAGGGLTAFDGIEFDVLAHVHGRRGRARGLDCDADGNVDEGVFGGVNTYGVGVVEFCRRLRERLGDGKLILADGMSTRSQRAFRILNGIESEGWPHLSDWEVSDWSGGLNRHFFWARNACPPALSYVNHKFVTRGDEPGRTKRPEVAWSIHRLVFAAAVFTDSAICYAFPPPRGKEELIGVWDELWMGTARQPGWLGGPLGPAVHLAERRPDLLRGEGRSFTKDFLARLKGEGVRFVREGRSLAVTASGPGRSELRFRLAGVPCDGPDLSVSVRARAAPMRGYPDEVARIMWVGIAPPEGNLTGPEMPRTGMCLRRGEETPLVKATGATVRWMSGLNLGGEALPAYFVHPPYKRCKGYTFWVREVRVPPGGRLECYTGMGARSPERSDGVTFRVLAGEVARGPGRYETVLEHVQKASKWTRHSVPLGKWGGSELRLKFVSDCGPADNTTADHSYWGDVWVVGPEGLGGVTRAARHMTWANNTAFGSTFYFSDIRSKQVDLEFTIEGAEPAWIEAVTAHAHPDAIVREFERGAVLANPSPRPYVFDLAEIFPGRGGGPGQLASGSAGARPRAGPGGARRAGGAFRRLQGSSRQDPKTNDGSAVSGSITLRPKDALFLVKGGGG